MSQMLDKIRKYQHFWHKYLRDVIHVENIVLIELHLIVIIPYKWCNDQRHASHDRVRGVIVSGVLFMIASEV